MELSVTTTEAKGFHAVQEAQDKRSLSRHQESKAGHAARVLPERQVKTEGVFCCFVERWDFVRLLMKMVSLGSN